MWGPAAFRYAAGMSQTLRVPLLAAFAVLFAVGACSTPATAPDMMQQQPPPPEDMALPPPPSPCALLKMSPRAWSAGPYGALRDNVADDFTLVDQNGPWSFKGGWSGCETYVFVPDSVPVSSMDKTSIWASDLDLLLQKSPPNVHYFFVSRATDAASVAKSLALMQAQLDSVLPALPEGSNPGQRDWWKARLHLVQGSGRDLQNWVGNLLRQTGAAATIGGYGFAIDRFQRLRGVGNYADIARYDPGLQAAGQWPWQNALQYAAHMPIYFNYESDREDALLAQKKVTAVKVYDHELLAGSVEKDVTLPDAVTMSKFDTLQVDLNMACPKKDKFEEWQISQDLKPENYNCGPWDYIVQIDLLDDDGKTWRELARFISTYHRAGRYLVDASQALPMLTKGGKRHIRYNVSPPWNLQTYDTEMTWRFIDNSKGMRPTQSAFLYAGGGFNADYNMNHATPVMVDIPKTAKKVELRAIITGHGGVAPDNCSEFCNHQHEFTVGGKAFLKQFDDTIGDDEGCLKQIDKGVVPNQSGTWWLGRGGWCPGAQVDPWVVDVTAQAPAGQAVTVSYRGLFRNQPVKTGRGDIAMSSWLVVYE